MAVSERAAAGAQGLAAEELPYPRIGYAWYVVGILLLAYTFSFVDRQILSLLVQPIRRDLAISDTEMSLLQGFSFAIFYTLMGLPLGRLVDEKSRRGIITIGIVLWSLMTAACGLARAYWQLFVYRMGVGVGEAALSPAAYSIISDYFPENRRATAIGIYAIGIYIGAGLALIIGGAVVDAVEGIGNVSLPVIGSIFGWQIVFFGVGLPGLAVALLMATVREPIRRGTVASASARAPGLPIADVARYFRANIATFSYHHLANAMLAFVGYGSGAWVPTFFIRVHGFSASEIGYYFGAIVLVFGTLGVTTGGLLADRLSSRGFGDAKMRVGFISAACALVPSALFPLVDSLSLAFPLLALGTFFGTIGIPMGPAAVQEIAPNQMRGQIAAVLLFVVNIIGLGFGPTAIAAMTDYVFGYDLAIRWSLSIVPGIALVLAALLFRLGYAPYRRSLEHLENWTRENGVTGDRDAA